MTEDTIYETCPRRASRKGRRWIVVCPTGYWQATEDEARAALMRDPAAKAVDLQTSNGAYRTITPVVRQGFDCVHGKPAEYVFAFYARCMGSFGKYLHRRLVSDDTLQEATAA